MALSKIDAANFLTGTLPAANINDTSINNITALPDGVGGSLVKLSTVTTSSTPTTIEFTGLDTSTYGSYMFQVQNLVFASSQNVNAW